MGKVVLTADGIEFLPLHRFDGVQEIVRQAMPTSARMHAEHVLIFPVFRICNPPASFIARQVRDE